MMANDKNEVKKVDQKEAEEVISMVYEDVMGFLYKSEQCKKWHNKNGSFISLGILNAVFNVIFGITPSKKVACQLVFSSLAEFLGDKDEKKKK